MYVHDIQHVEIKILSEQHFYRYKTSLILPSKLKLTMIKGVKEMLIVIKYQQTISLKVKNNLANSALTEDNNTCLTISLLSPRGVQNVLKLLCLFLGENFPVEMVLYIYIIYVCTR